MKRPQSIRARLIALYVGTLSLIFIGFAGYTYWGFEAYLIQSLRQTLTHRAQQIATTILSEMPQKGEAYVASEIQLRYAPEQNDRIIRIMDSNGRPIYASGNADMLPGLTSLAFDREGIKASPMHREEMSLSGERFQVVALGYQFPDGAKYAVEVGGSEKDIFSSLNGLLLTLSLGFPIFIGLTSVGAYMLIGRALRPVDEIVQSAEQITLHNLSQRLPVVKTGDEVERLSLALNRMIRRLDEAFQITSRFSADASHELRTPLTIMRGELEALLKEEELKAEQAGQVASILEEAVRLTQIVEGLLLISRLDAGESQMRRDAIDWGRLVSMTVEQMSPLAEDKQIELSCQVEPDITVEATEMRLKQVVVNLLDNAIKYTSEGGRIAVTVGAVGAEAVLEIVDNGIGISGDALPRVFQRFFRSEQILARKARGTGLGLSMVQSIVETHGGRVTVHSRENEGSIFRVYLPRHSTVDFKKGD